MREGRELGVEKLSAELFQPWVPALDARQLGSCGT